MQVEFAICHGMLEVGGFSSDKKINLEQNRFGIKFLKMKIGLIVACI